MQLIFLKTSVSFLLFFFLFLTQITIFGVFFFLLLSSIFFQRLLNDSFLLFISIFRTCKIAKHSILSVFFLKKIFFHFFQFFFCKTTVKKFLKIIKKVFQKIKCFLKFSNSLFSPFLHLTLLGYSLVFHSTNSRILQSSYIF